MDANIYDQIMASMSKIEDGVAQKEFFEAFWATMDREERVVFTIDALKSFERDGTLKSFIKETNDVISDKQDVIMDQFICKEMSHEEYIDRIKKVRKIETKSHTKE